MKFTLTWRSLVKMVTYKVLSKFEGQEDDKILNYFEENKIGLH